MKLWVNFLKVQKIGRQLYSQFVLNLKPYERHTHTEQPLIHVVGPSVLQLP